MTGKHPARGMETRDDLCRRAARALETGGLFELLTVLNASSVYRFTGVYQFDGRWVKSVFLFDRENPTVPFGSDVLWDDSYCRMTATHGDAFEIANALTDHRVRTHTARERVQCYIGVHLRRPDNSSLGTLCHYDVIPRPTPGGALDDLRAIRPLVEQAMARSVTRPA